MRKIDWSALDGTLLRLLVTVLETGSITAAALRLGVTQSAVSHLLNNLRAITGDELFVKSGRGIVATARAETLGAEARELLRQLERFARSGGFDPARWQTTVTIAANDFQRDLLLPPLANRLRVEAPGVRLRVVPSGAPSVESLRDDAYQLMISPRPPEGADIFQKRLFQDRYRVFFDGAAREAPKNRAEYLAAEHITVLYEPRRRLEIDRHLSAKGFERRVSVMVPAFGALPAFIRGTALLATVPGLLAPYTLAGLGHARAPVPCPVLSMYMVWHARYQQDPAHGWLRQVLQSAAAPVLAGLPHRAP
jgi:DNA-binding transcriptional LysR family regulator